MDNQSRPGEGPAIASLILGIMQKTAVIQVVYG